MAVDYDYLPVSNGSGDAVLMHVSSNRLVGATTLVVDSVTNVPTKFIATSGTLTSAGLIDPATKTDFKGHLSGSNIIIDSFEPGSTDLGNTAGQVVIIKPNTGWANRVAAHLKNMAGLGTPEDITVNSIAIGAWLGAVYPVGSIYISTSSTNPTTLFGFGTWTAFATGRTLIGVGTSDQAFAAGTTGGESNHALTSTEMPVHNHGVNDPGHVHDIHLQANTAAGGTNRGSQGGDSNSDLSGTGISIQNAGGGAAHNNLPPYVVTYMWQRTA